MTRFTKTARMAAMIAATGFSLMTASAAFAEGSEGGAVDAAMADKLTAQMIAEGFDVRKLQMEDGMIEVYAVKDGATYELYYGADLVLIRSCTDGVCTDATGAEVAGDSN